jgi:hypothetical protein
MMAAPLDKCARILQGKLKLPDPVPVHISKSVSKALENAFMPNAAVIIAGSGVIVILSD